MSDGFKGYQQQIISNARELARAIQDQGFRIVSGGTNNHCFLVDVFSKGITGKQAEEALEEAGITVNKNSIPFDTHPPLVTSGIRIGTPAVTTRQMGEEEMAQIGALIGRVLKDVADRETQQEVRAKVKALTSRFPLYTGGWLRPSPVSVRHPALATTSLEEIFEPGGILSGQLPSYEFRESQQIMAKAVLDAIANRRSLCVEAGTGTGKTLAYLIPALFSQKRVIVSTATKNLQDSFSSRTSPLFESTCFRIWQ